MPADILPPVPEGKAQKAPYSPVVMTFGAEGFFGYGPSTSSLQRDPSQDGLAYDTVKPFGPEAMWWSTYSQEEVSEKKDIDSSLIRQQLLERHAKWKDPVIQKIIHGKMDIRCKTQTWVTPKLPTWVRGGLILIGDAAHGESTNDSLRTAMISLTSNSTPFNIRPGRISGSGRRSSFNPATVALPCKRRFISANLSWHNHSKGCNTYYRGTILLYQKISSRSYSRRCK